MEICLVCSSEMRENGLIICDSCNLPISQRITKVIEILSTPEDSDEIWWCIGELEEIVKTLNSERIGK